MYDDEMGVLSKLPHLCVEMQVSKYKILIFLCCAEYKVLLFKWCQRDAQFNLISIFLQYIPRIMNLVRALLVVWHWGLVLVNFTQILAHQGYITGSGAIIRLP